MHESESRSVVSHSLWPQRLYSPWTPLGQILEWVAFPFSRGSFQPRKWTGVSCIAGGFFTNWAIRKARYRLGSVQFSSVQSLSCFRLFATPWIAACQASLSITNSQSSLKLTSIELVMPSSHLIFCRPLLLLPPMPPASGSFPMSQLQSIGVSALASFLPKKSQGWSPSEWTGWISS